ncbi:hypothetical protein GQ457_06G016940 [Hibiscus cannabinus]
MVQHGLQQVQDIIEKVHDIVDFLNASDARLKRFVEKIEKLLDILEVFKATTNIISGSEYQTANLFLGVVQRIKVLLDVKSESLDDFVKSMVENMKERFTKYWDECNLLMAIGSVMDPRLKMRAVEIAFPKMFPLHLVMGKISKVKDIMYQLFDEYLRMYSLTFNVEESGECAFPMDAHGDVTSSGLFELLQDVFSGETSIPQVKNELDLYLDEGCVFSQDAKFDAITCAGSRVIDPYRASLTPETVQMLMCTGDWYRSLDGVKRKNKDFEHFELYNFELFEFEFKFFVSSSSLIILSSRAFESSSASSISSSSQAQHYSSSTRLVYTHSLEKWSATTKYVSRRAWLSISGLPIHLWSKGSFRNIFGLWGRFLRVDAATEESTSFESARILIEALTRGRIDEVVEVASSGTMFFIVVQEAKLVWVLAVEQREVLEEATLSKQSHEVSVTLPQSDLPMARGRIVSPR